jgi:hypothetical protein
MSNLDALLQEIKPAAPVLRLAHAVEDEIELSPGRAASYVSLRPLGMDAVGVYVHSDRVSLALDPAIAQSHQQSLPGAKARVSNTTTWYLVVPAATVDSHYAEVLDLAVAAVLRRKDGTDYKKSADGIPSAASPKAKPVPETCPECWTQFSVSGVCHCG